jgi:hypothetical protein
MLAAVPYMLAAVPYMLAAVPYMLALVYKIYAYISLFFLLPLEGVFFDLSPRVMTNRSGVVESRSSGHESL